MKLVLQTAPYIRKNVSVKRMMIDVLIALAPLVIFAFLQNGVGALTVFSISILTMLGGEILIHALIKWPSGMKFKELFSKEGFKKLYACYSINNITAPLISALIFALMMPAKCSGYVMFLSAAFGIVVGKMLFGGLGSNIFNPAATARVFALICFGSKITYGSGSVEVVAGGTPLALVGGNLGNISEALKSYSLFDLFVGQIPGSMGEVSALLILVGAIYLFARRSADLRSCLAMILSFALLTSIVSAVTANIAKVNGFELFAYEMLSGGLLFGAVFMITDPITSPVTKFGRIVFGVIAGSVTALIRYCGAYPEGVAFSILIANLCVPMIDHLMRGRKNTYTWQQILGVALSMVVLGLILGFAVAGQLGGL